MVLPAPPPNSEPIPQGPFYSPTTENICSQLGNLNLGCGLAVCYDTGTLVAIGDGTGSVQLINTGTGLTGGPITVSGTVALAPVVPTSQGCYIYPTSVEIDPYGRVTSVTPGEAPVVASAFNAKGEIIAGTGFPSSYSALPPGALYQVLMADPAAPLGVRWEYNVGVGIVTITGSAPVAITNPTGPTTSIAIDPATLTSCGAVQLNDTVTSTSVSEAATANSVKTTYDVAFSAQTTADAALPKTGGTMTGDIVFTDGQPVDAGLF